MVVLQLIGPNFRLLLYAEMHRPGEDEIGTALRVIERVLHQFPRAFDLLMFIAHTVFHTFCDRNLKPAFRNRYSMLFIAEQLRTAFVFGDWDRIIPTQ